MTENEDQDLDPVEVLRAMLAIKPEDAKKVREDADEKADPKLNSREGK
jgi:hypothetical protein